MEVEEKKALIRFLEEQAETFNRIAQCLDMDEVALIEAKAYLVGLSHGFAQSGLAVLTSGALTPAEPEEGG